MGILKRCISKQHLTTLALAQVSMNRVAAVGAASGLMALGFYSGTDAHMKFELASATGPLVRLLDPETSHKLGILAAKMGLFPTETRKDPQSLRVNLWGKQFSNPLGLAAGFDKDAEVIEPMLGIGFGFVEVGSITPEPQPGNPKPRVFRLKELKASINRYGFNSQGAEAAAQRLEAFTQKAAQDPSVKPGVLFVNLGKNKTTEKAADDYCTGLQKLGKYADVVVINVSSPNTPGLRSLQGRRELEQLVEQVQETRKDMEWGPAGPPPLLVKIAPDLTEADKMDIAAVVTRTGVDGLIVSNTTIARPAEVQAYPEAQEAGGLSGPPLFEPSTKVLADMYRLTGGRVPLIGCGGISTGEQAYKKIRAGASLVEIYTSMAFDGPVVVPNIKQQLAECLQRDGYESIQQAVGADVDMGKAKIHYAEPAGKAAAQQKRWFSWGR